MTEKTSSASVEFLPSQERIRVAIVASDIKQREKLSALVANTRRFRLVSSVAPKQAHNSIPAEATDLIVGHANNEIEFGVFLEVAKSLAEIPSLLFVSGLSNVDTQAEDLAVSAIAEIGDLSERDEIILQLDSIADQPIVTGVPRSVAQERDEILLALLTERECEVLIHTANGLSIKEIARELNRSYGTIASHRASLMEKTSIHDKVGLARFAIRSRLIAA